MEYRKYSVVVQDQILDFSVGVQIKFKRRHILCDLCNIYDNYNFIWKKMYISVCSWFIGGIVRPEVTQSIQNTAIIDTSAFLAQFLEFTDSIYIKTMLIYKE